MNIAIKENKCSSIFVVRDKDRLEIAICPDLARFAAIQVSNGASINSSIMEVSEGVFYRVTVVYYGLEDLEIITANMLDSLLMYITDVTVPAQDLKPCQVSRDEMIGRTRRGI